MGPDLVIHGSAPSATRTRDLLLRRHSQSVGRSGRMRPDVPLTCGDNRSTSLPVAPRLWSLAPSLAPREIISRANPPRINAGVGRFGRRRTRDSRVLRLARMTSPYPGGHCGGACRRCRSSSSCAVVNTRSCPD